MSVADYIIKQPVERREILSAINEVIIRVDKHVKAEVGTMMGKEMILYKTSGVFKYGLSIVKKHISLHVLPIYGSPTLHARYQKLFDKAKLQKGCINFKNANEMPLNIVADLINDCAKVDMVAIMRGDHHAPQ
jgi:hypothetical protein